VHKYATPPPKKHDPASNSDSPERVMGESKDAENGNTGEAMGSNEGESEEESDEESDEESGEESGQESGEEENVDGDVASDAAATAGWFLSSRRKSIKSNVRGWAICLPYVMLYQQL